MKPLSVDAKTEITIEASKWAEEITDIQTLLDGCFVVCKQELEQIGARFVSILLTDDQHMRQLNCQYRQKDQPTNVLSFTSGFFPGAPLGDIALGLETCLYQAKQQNVPLGEHLCHLFVHGILHLVGFDHQDAATARQMEQMESKILTRAGHMDPWAQGVDA